LFFSGNLRAVASGLNGVVRSDLASLFKTYFLYEVSRVRRSAGGKAKLESVMLHQLIRELRSIGGVEVFDSKATFVTFKPEMDARMTGKIFRVFGWFLTCF